MINKILLTILVLTSVNITAQDPRLSDNFTIEVGEEYGETDGSIRNFYKYKDNVIGINRHKDHLVIQKFDPNTLKEIDRVEYEKFFKDKRKEDLDKILRLGSNVLFFYAQWDRKTQIESLEYQSISLETFEVSDFNEIIKQEGKIAGNFSFVSGGFFIPFKGETSEKYHYKTNHDEDKLLIAYRLKPKYRDDSKSYDRVSINAFNEELNAEWNGQIEMPYTEERMDNMDFAIDRNANFFMLAKVYEADTTDEKKKDKKGTNHHLEIFKVKKDTESIINNKIEIGDKFVDEVLLHENVEGNMVIAGTSKNPNTGKTFGFFSTLEMGNATGVFSAKLEETGEVSDFNNYNFPVEMLMKNAARKEKRDIKRKDNKGNKGEEPSFQHLKPNIIAENKDGSFLILGEQRYIVVTSSTGTGMGKMSSSTTYHYRDILAAKINVDGSLAWMHKLPKRQEGRRGKGTMSFSHMFAGDNHYLLYLDNVKNLDLPDDKYPYRHSDGKGGYFTAYIINDKTGEVKKEAIFNTRDFNDTELEHFKTDKIFPLSDSEILIEGFEGRNKDFLVKVSAKK